MTELGGGAGDPESTGSRNEGPSGGASPPSPPPPTGMEYLSFSRLNSYDMCGEKFRLSYIERFPGQPMGAAIGGSAVHQVIETAEIEGWWEREHEEASVLLTQAFRAVFDERVEAEGGKDKIRWGGKLDRDGNRIEGYLWWWEYAGNLFLRRYITVRQRDAKAGWQLLEGGVEMEVGAVLDLEDHPDGGIYVKGYIDALPYVTEDGEFVIRDWKTGTFNQPFQLAVYAWLLKQGRGLTVTRGQIGYLRGTKPESWIKEYDVGPWVDLVPRRFTDLAAGISAGIFPLKPSNLCSTCMVRAYCDYGKTLAEDGDALS